MLKINKQTLTKLAVKLTVVASIVLFSAPVYAETTDFGGAGERFKGRGDRTPPRCQISVPSAADAPFFVSWNCTDNDADPAEIRTELWIIRNGAAYPTLIGNFLGFPAGVRIDETVLQVDSFASGLPVSFRLVARDRAGIATLSPVSTVLSQDTSLDTCDLSIITEGTESTGDTTGVPALTVKVDDAEVVTQQVNSNTTRIFTPVAAEAVPCEIESACDNEAELFFDASIVLNSSLNASGTLAITPGNIALNVTGTGTVNSAVLETLTVSGSTVIDGANAEVVLSCSQ